MSPNTNHLLRSLLCVPMASTAVFNGAMPQPAWAFHHENVLGTSMAVTLRAGNRNEAESAEAALLASIDREDLIFSSWSRESWNRESRSRESWSRDSEVSRWLGTRGNAVKLPPELLEVLGLFDYWREATGGALDASAETAVRLWQRAAAEHRQPMQTEIERAVEAMQQTHWQVDRLGGTAAHLSDTPLAFATFTKSYIAGHAADAALARGATGVMLNIGGDIVVRGDLAQMVDIANPLASAENDAAIDRILVRDRAVATSGSYRRGFHLTANSSAQPEFSHIIDPRTARPAGHILSSTVVARDPATAGALATAFSVLGVDESRSLAASLSTKHGGIEYLLSTRDGERIASDGWRAYQAPSLRTAAYAAPPAPAAGSSDKSVWNQNYELDINLELARIDDFRYRRPYVAIWVEGQDHLPVRTIAVWSGKLRYLPELRSWYHTAQLRGNEDDILRTVSSATRSPGRYTLKWDGKDDEGNFVKSGEYTIYIEVAREHGSYQILRQPMDFSGQPKQVTLPAGSEIGGATLDYHKR
jgi:thiamine biosynthesis lipoprotein